MKATAVKERPILFSGPMVRAILDGPKLVTRRPIKLRVTGPNPPRGLFDFYAASGPGSDLPGVWVGAVDGATGKGNVSCPYGAPGDRLFVRETLRLDVRRNTWHYPADGKAVQVRADDNDAVLAMASWAHHKEGEVCVAIHMPRWASRLTLEVREVRAERLQAITEEDARAEGVTPGTCDHPDCSPGSCAVSRYRPAFAAGWNALYAKRPELQWGENPWCWRIEFRRVEEAAR